METLEPLVKQVASLGWTEGLNALLSLEDSTSSAHQAIRRFAVLVALEHEHLDVAQDCLSQLPSSDRVDGFLLGEALKQRSLHAADTLASWLRGQPLSGELLEDLSARLGDLIEHRDETPIVGRLWAFLLQHPKATQTVVRRAMTEALERGDEAFVNSCRGRLERLVEQGNNDSGLLFRTFASAGRVDLLDDFAPEHLSEDDAITALGAAAHHHHLAACQWLFEHMRRAGMEVHEYGAAGLLIRATFLGELGEYEVFQRDLIEALGHPQVCAAAWRRLHENDQLMWSDEVADAVCNQLFLLASPSLQHEWMARSTRDLEPARALLRDRAAQQQEPRPDRSRLRS